MRVFYRKLFGFVTPYIWYIWRTINLVNWEVMHIGGHFSLVNRVILFIIHMILSSVGIH